MTLPELLPGLDAAPNVHPMFVHLPLGLWPTALGFFLFGAAKRSERLLETGRWLLYLATAAAVAAATTGWLAADRIGHSAPGHDLVHIHRDWMIAATGISALSSTMVFLLRRSQGPARRWIQVTAVAITFGVATLGADRGAYLVFGKGVGVSRQTDPQHQEQRAQPDQEHSHEH